MAQINEMELQTLRHMIGAHDMTAKKLETYAQQCTDPQFKQMFQKDAQEARTAKQQLMTFLS